MSSWRKCWSFSIRIHDWKTVEYRKQKKYWTTPIVAMANAARMNFEMPVLLINLKRQPDRRKQSLKLLRELGFSNIQVVDAFDGTSFLHECSGRARKKTQWRLTNNVDVGHVNVSFKNIGPGKRWRLWFVGAACLCSLSGQDLDRGEIEWLQAWTSTDEVIDIIDYLWPRGWKVDPHPLLIVCYHGSRNDASGSHCSERLRHVQSSEKGWKTTKVFSTHRSSCFRVRRGSSRAGLCVAKGAGRLFRTLCFPSQVGKVILRRSAVVKVSLESFVPVLQPVFLLVCLGMFSCSCALVGSYAVFLKLAFANSYASITWILKTKAESQIGPSLNSSMGGTMGQWK